MTSEQTILFTVLARGVATDGRATAVSVYVSPRLRGASALGSFPDWLHWTRRLHDHGLVLEFASGGATTKVAVDKSPLRPDLWEQIFHQDTLVRSHAFNDYTDRGILSYPVRQALSVLKTIYQEAAVTLALPDPEGSSRNRDGGNRDTLRRLIDGLDVHWNGDRAKSWRDAVRQSYRSMRANQAQQALSGPLDAEGLIEASPDPAAFQKVAVPFAVFHHMPTPPLDDLVIDTATVLDFHQALSALNAYPALLRALGLVFDIALPEGFLKPTPLGQIGTVSVVPTGFSWETPTKTPALTTGYINYTSGQAHLFGNAPRSLADPSAPTSVIGLLDLDGTRFGLAQVDVDGGMHKAIMLAETLNNPDPARNLDPDAQPEDAAHPEVFDPEATLPSLRSGGLSLYADARGLQLLDMLSQSKTFNNAVESGGVQHRPFFAEDLVRGFRLDVWDSRTGHWHSLHRRDGDYLIGELPFHTTDEEGFIQTAVTQPAKGASPETNDLYIHEAVARWAGWSLSVSRPGKHLSRHADPDKAVPPNAADPDFLEDQPDTPFKMTVDYQVVAGSLPRLKFGARYRIRARAVDLAGNSLLVDDAIADRLARLFALPRDPEGFTYLRYEPVGAPLLILCDPRGVTDPGSALDRLVIRTFNAAPDQDAAAADQGAGERHLVPPRTSVEMAERLGMFDDAAGKLKSDAATWQLIGQRDAGKIPSASLTIAGMTDDYPVVSDDRIDELPYLPDPLSRGAAIRDLPGALVGSIGQVRPGAGASGPITYVPLSDPNPRPGSATLISFGGEADWQGTVGFRLALEEPPPGPIEPAPTWDPAARVLTVFLAKGQTRVVPVTSYMTPEDLNLMGVWQWLRGFVERITVTNPRPEYLAPGQSVDRLAHVLQRAVEGGHWMLTPPRLVTLVHALQQPLGRPEFCALRVLHEVKREQGNPPLQSESVTDVADPNQLAPIVALRRPGATDAYLTGALKIHGASTAKVDLFALWVDPVDDLSAPGPTSISRTAHVDEIPLPDLREAILLAPGTDRRSVGLYDPQHDQIAFIRSGDRWGSPDENQFAFFADAAPRHLLGDAKHHRVTYSAVAASRYREYFPPDVPNGFTRESHPVVVGVPASIRPLAPDVAFVVPTFGWQRQTDTNLKRSIRFGGGLRVYLRRPWFSSGEGELLGVALWSDTNGNLTNFNRDKFKPFITQWGMDPIWQTAPLGFVPTTSAFPDRVAMDCPVSLDERTARAPDGSPGRVDVVGFPAEFDPERKLWFADLTIDTPGETYAPFVRLALVRYQPHALADSKVSRVVLADFAQLTPDRTLTITADPHHPRALRVAVSGVAPRGPQAVFRGSRRLHGNIERPTQVRVRVQRRDPVLDSDLAWSDVGTDVAAINASHDGPTPLDPDLALWSGTVRFVKVPEPGEFRLLVEEFEFISANYNLVQDDVIKHPSRLIYAESIVLDTALVGGV
ncbi:MAG: hypothetical protein EXS05_00920 [Planctomycetaceae bacterium]|nr:hypothetical protein [Planctomycetaceae bacterium]